MADVYSTYEAKSKFSEIVRKVRNGRRVTITYRGEEIAEVSPIRKGRQTVEERLRYLEEEGQLSRGKPITGPVKPLVRRPGALKRFLESRE